MSQGCRMKLLEHEAQLSKSEVELERLKNKKLGALIKTGVARHLETRSKEKTMAVDHKLKEIAMLKAEIGAKDRVDGFAGKISALEMANLKLSAQIEDLILETKREIYGAEAITLKHANQGRNTSNESNPWEQKPLDKKPVVYSQLGLKSVGPRTEKKYETRHPRNIQDNPVTPRKVTSMLKHENDVDHRRPATTSATCGANRKVVPKHPEVVVCSSFDKNVSEFLHPVNKKPLKRQERKLRLHQKDEVHHLSKNCMNTSPIKKNETSPCLPNSPIPRDQLPSRNKMSLDKTIKVFPVQPLTVMLDTHKKTHENTRQEMTRFSPKQLTPRAIKINQLACHEAKVNNQLSINLPHQVDKKELTLIKSADRLPGSSHGDEIVQDTLKHRTKIDGTPQLSSMGRESNQEGDFQRQSQIAPCTNKSEDEYKEDYIQQLLLNLTPRSAQTDSGPSRNSSASISPKNDKSRRWYERLPIPDVELFDDSPDLNNACSTDSDSSETIPVNLCPRPGLPRQEYDAWTYLGDQTALMPRPLIRKSCKFVENLESLSFTDGDTESIEDN